MKKLIITITSLLIMVEHIVAGAGVVIVSDPGQAQGRLISTEDIVPFIHIDLTASNTTSDQTVYLTIEQSGAIADADLFVGSISNKLTGMKTTLGPFMVQSGQTNDIVIFARVNSVNATTNSSPTVTLDLMTVSNSTPGVVQGVLPINGTPYIVDTNSEEVVHGVITSISLTFNDDEYGGYYLLTLTAKADPLRRYTLEHSLDMVSWEEWLTGIQPAGLTGNFQVDAFLNPTNFPNKGFFRLKSQ